MTSLEYMQRQIVKHKLNHDREFARNAPEEMLANIRMKISFFEDAVRALSERPKEGQ